MCNHTGTEANQRREVRTVKETYIFMRHEIKYILNDAQRGIVEEAMRGRMLEDEFGKSTICSLYFDTPDFRLIRRSIEKPPYKEKMRLRSYGRAEDDDYVFLELKKKYNGVVYKRRLKASLQEACGYMEGSAALPASSQIGREIDYFRSFYPDLKPRVYICYDRVAYYSLADRSFRMTFDKNIRWRRSDLNLSSAPCGNPLLEADQSLLEIKTPGGIPLWLVAVLSKCGLHKANFSKYANAYMEMLLNGDAS